MSSAVDAELGAIFYYASSCEVLRTALGEMGHQQPTTSIQVGNYTTVVISNGTINQKCYKAMGMRFYWVKAETFPHILETWYNKPSRLFHEASPHGYHRRMHPVYLYYPVMC